MSGIPQSPDTPRIGLNDRTWQELLPWLKKTLARERMKLESPNCPPRQDDHARGRIHLLKEILNFDPTIDPLDL